MDTIESLRKKALALPETPGVYIMKNAHDDIIYIGKAKSLKNRVSQYFGTGNQHTLKVRKMVENVQNFEYILCDSEFEAFILESSLIKQHLPKYNILLKDDKHYPYIAISKEKYPKLSIKRDAKSKKHKHPHKARPDNSRFRLSSASYHSYRGRFAGKIEIYPLRS